MRQRAARLRCECVGQRTRPNPRLVVEVRREQRFVVLGKEIDAVDDAVGAQRNRERRQLGADLLQHALGIGAAAIGLVHEDQRRNPQTLERAHQDARLRLHALDSRHDEHDAVEDAQHSLHLRDEVRMAGRVDQVDGDVVDRERDDRRFDRDSALLFER